ncbi:amidohydrolase family protein [Halonatronum saccharophilum]|uniref:amidohydrolase family protein n=1 Tax=Halonatronum saccharophilum TaxID=150060 RepID=UPI0004868099|nr:amidohydrolase family protein [Halonatronum saccharophilum]
MVIDSHLHFGKIGKFDMGVDVLLESLDKYGIDFGIVSNIEGVEFDTELRKIPKEFMVSQMEVNKKTLELVKDHFDKLIGLVWIKPHTESFTNELGDFILDNRDYFVGFKIHPYHSKLKISDDRYKEYLGFANEISLPCAVHTAKCPYSDIGDLYKVAKEYSKVNFIAVHMGLGSDNSRAIDYISKLDNLYGDTTWVPLERVIDAVEGCGSHKILFGTDNPIDGLDTYQKYEELLIKGRDLFKEEDYQDIFSLNAKRIFGLELNS